MRLRPRGVALLLGPAAALALLPWPGGSHVWGLVLVLGSLGCCVLDATLGVRRNAVSVTRDLHSGRLSVGRPAHVVLRFENRTSRRLRLTFRDAVPRDLVPEGSSGRFDLAPRTTVQHTYRIRPQRRGEYGFEACWVELAGPLDLATRFLRYEPEGRVSVIPDIQPLRMYAIQGQAALSRMKGLHRRRRPGEGGELESLREYRAGDDPRRIHWKATARRMQPVTVETESERSRNVFFLVDAGRWMSQTAGILLKADHALNATLLAAHVAARRGDRVGAMVFSDRVLAYVPPGRGRVHDARLLEALHRVPVEPVEPDFEEAFRFLALRSKRRSLVVLFSDFSDPVTASALERTLSVVSRRHLVLCVHLLDHALEDLATLTPRTVRDVARRSVAEGLVRDRRLVLDRLRLGGAHVLECDTGSLTGEVLSRYLAIKGQGLL